MGPAMLREMGPAMLREVGPVAPVSPAMLRGTGKAPALGVVWRLTG